jgi:S1-C subfamily serine protease
VTSANSGGSGVLIVQKGSTYLVLTNKHVIGCDRQFQIQTPDGKKHTAKLVPNAGINPKYDIAIKCQGLDSV